MSPPIFGIQPGDLGLSGVQRHQVLDYYCLEGIEEAFVFQENFDTPIALNPRWDTVGKVEDVSRSTGWEKIGVDLETPASMMLSKKNLFSIKDDRRAADPPLEWAWRVFCTPPPVPWDATLVCGTVFHETDDDEVYFAFFATLDTDMVYQWSVGVKDGNPDAPPIVVPTHVPVSTSCTRPQLLGMQIRPERVTAKIDGFPRALITPPAGSLGRVMKAGIAAIRENPDAEASIQADYFAGSQGYLCTENP